MLQDCLDTMGAQNVKYVNRKAIMQQLNGRVFFNEIRLVYHDIESAVSSNGAQGSSALCPSRHHKNDIVALLRDSGLTCNNRPLKFMPEVSPERQSVRTAAGIMYSFLRGHGIDTDARVKAEYNKTVSFYVMEPGMPGGHGKLLGNFISNEVGWELHSDILKSLNIDMPLEECNRRLKPTGVL